jgi:hypothetical protein
MNRSFKRKKKRQRIIEDMFGIDKGEVKPFSEEDRNWCTFRVRTVLRSLCAK